MMYAHVLMLATGGVALFAFAEHVLLARASASHPPCDAPVAPRWTGASTGTVLVCAAGFVSISLTQGGVLSAIAAAILILAARADLHFRVVPNEIVGVGAALALSFRIWDGLPLLEPILAATAAASALLVVRVAGQWSKGRPGMGMGDIKLGAVLGLAVGWNALWILYLGAIFVALFGAAHRASGRPFPVEVPFAPFIAAGGVAAWAIPFATVYPQ